MRLILGLLVLGAVLSFQNCSNNGFQSQSTTAMDSQNLGQGTPLPVDETPPPPIDEPETPPVRTLTANPQNFKSMMSSLKPGDQLMLKPGKYPPFYVSNLHGQADHWISIESEDPGNPAVIEGTPSANVIEVRSSSYVAIKNLKIDGMNNGASFGISAGGGDSNFSHHIRIENNEFTRFSGHQQQVAISTKTTAWDWVIRGNRIMDAGAGLYLGNSNGANSFIGGVIEYNLIQQTLGYNMQIKFQTSRPSLAGMPTTPQKTIIRHNVFMKANLPSPDGARPNLLLGGFPATGNGSNDLHEVYGNFFYDNPTGEAHIQASGRVAIYNNIFVKGSFAAIRLQNHDAPLRLAHIFNNTIYDVPTGVSVGSAGSIETRVVGNLIFANNPISGSPTVKQDNITDAIANAGSYVNAPTGTLGVGLDLYPISGNKTLGAAIDMSAFTQYTDANKDFNRQVRSDYTYRGAYGGQGANTGWKLNRGIKN